MNELSKSSSGTPGSDDAASSLAQNADAVIESDDEERSLMERFGITRVPADRFHYRQWRYSSLGEALAQARRDNPRA